MPTKTQPDNKIRNPADDLWADKLAAELSSLEAVGSPDEEAAAERAKSWDPNKPDIDEAGNEIDQDDATEAVRDGEQAKEKPGWRTNVEKRRKAAETGRMAARFLPGAKGNKWASGGIIGLLIGGAFGSSLLVAGPFSLLINFHDISSNNSSLGQHIYTKFGNSYLRAFFAGQGRDCTGKIGCKFTNITEKRKAQLEKRGFKVTASPSKIPGLLKLQGLEFKDGNKTVTINTRADFRALRFTNFTAYAQFQRIPMLAQFLNPSAALSTALKKFGINLADKLRSNKDPDKAKRAAENKKATNAKTGADNDPAKNAERVRKKIGDAGKAEADKIKAKLGSFKNSIKLGSGFAMWGGFAACVGYDLIRAAKGAMTLAWHEELLKFVAPFLSAGAMAKEGDIDWETAEMFGDRLMQPVTEADVRNNPKLYTSDMVGKTAMDSKAFASALNGDSPAIDGTYAQYYTSWSPASNVIGAGIIDKVRSFIPGGHTTIKLACQAVVWGMLLAMKGCIKGKWTALVCAAVGLLEFAAFNIFGDDVMKWAVDELSGPALDAIAAANLDADLHGPALGEALFTARSILGTYAERAGAFPVAANSKAVAQAYTDMYSDPDYIDEQVAYAKSEASKNQLDLTNQYSFASQITSRVASITGDGTLFSIIANIPSIVSLNTVFESTAHATKEGIFQPIQIFHSQEAIDGTIANCKDPALQGDDIGINIPGMGASCQPVPVVPQVVQDCLDEEAGSEGTVCIVEAIDYLSTHNYTDPDENMAQKPYIDGDTGIPTGFEEFSEDEEKDYTNPLLMYWQYCGPQRKFPPGYTNKSVGATALDNIDLMEEVKSGLGGDTDIMSMIGGASDGAANELYNMFVSPNDSWYDFNYCADGRWADSLVGDSTTFAWMSYYVSQCIIHASMEDTKYCWEDSKEETTTPTPCGLAGSSPSLGDFSTGNGTRGKPRMIIVHTTEGDSIDGMTQALRANGTSYHVAIDESGKAYQVVPDNKIANAAKNANTDSLNIALVGKADEGDRLNPSSAQMKTLSGCIKDWATEYDIPLEKVSGKGILNGGSTKGIAGHIDVAQASGYTDRYDPGRRFPWEEVIANAK